MQIWILQTFCKLTPARLCMAHWDWEWATYFLSLSGWNSFHIWHQPETFLFALCFNNQHHLDNEYGMVSVVARDGVLSQFFALSFICNSITVRSSFQILSKAPAKNGSCRAKYNQVPSLHRSNWIWLNKSLQCRKVSFPLKTFGWYFHCKLVLFFSRLII